MKAFHGDPAIKAKYVERMKAHIAADDLVQGTGFENGRGCSIGCTFDDYDHSKYETELGLPVELARLNDAIFEGLPVPANREFALAFLEAVPVGADCSDVCRAIAHTRHTRDLARLENNNEPYAVECRKAIRGVLDWLAGGAASAAESAESALSAARSAWSAARSAENAESAWSAASAAESAESALSAASARMNVGSAVSAARGAASAKWSAASAASAASAKWSAASAEESARSAAYEIEASTLLDALRACKTKTATA